MIAPLLFIYEYMKKSRLKGVEGTYKAKKSNWKFSRPKFALHGEPNSPQYHSKIDIQQLQLAGKCPLGTFKIISTGAVLLSFTSVRVVAVSLPACGINKASL